MHEWALAEAVVQTALQHAKQNKLQRLTRVKVVIGELQQIELDCFRFNLENVLQEYGKDIAPDIFEFAMEPATLGCNNCRHQWQLSQHFSALDHAEKEYIHFVPEVVHSHLQCPQCQSVDFTIVKGRGVYIDFIEGENHGPA